MIARILFGEPRPTVRESVKWLGRALPLVLRDGRPIQRMMAGG